MTVCGSGSASARSGLGINYFVLNAGMPRVAMENADGEMLLVVQHGRILVTTEFGRLISEPNYILVIPRGVKFKVDLLEPNTDDIDAKYNKDNEFARGYFCEIFNGNFDLPERGPIGANSLASEIDFEVPTSHYEKDLEGLED
mmetsp:Transcript_30830/g.67211  ORF Transcript_30830/g.67211 Transcript_30830/m.67211 type:complete len:143 (-) Transcript_30830:675-1103(-)|eukprot:CAMPEP_0116927414 /NCGR_PEP_ID=MMETSP0467-20121206/25332_1 /TAXON_ID=283647 /ORGANISM="Mesodinium pulex, Strain SPMC105" /LENGTH=142 /DNA_ID=CAMNT_0004606909 /DNA_START=396 /DNA_END=824 /DNA_ORIENTATION=+